MPRLPDTYQEVEYIQSSGTQYINTGLAIKDGYKIICKANFTTSYNGYQLLGGYIGQSGSTYYRLYGGLYNNNLVYGFLDNYSNNAGSLSLNTDCVLEHSMVSGNLYFKVNGTTIGSSSATYSTSLGGDICVLAGYRQDYSGYYEKRYAKVYYYKIYDNTDTLIRDLVPCYRKSDNVIGMYDLVNNQFYTNSGTGTFIKGDDVLYTGKIQKMFIWQSGIEYQIYPSNPPENWVLFTETDLSTGNLGLFSAETTSWDGRYNRTLASITNDGQGNYYYQTGPRAPVCLRLRGNYPTLMSIQSGYTNRKVKVVYDYLCIAGNATQGMCGRYNRDSSYAPCMTCSGNTNRGAANANVIYTAEIIMDVGANTESGSIFLKSDGSKVRDFGPNTMPTATSGTYYENDCWLGYGTDTENIGVRLGDIHIFTYDY